MPERFTISNLAGGLGDWLSLTPTLRIARDKGLNPLVLAHDSPHTREFATLYQGLAEVEFRPAGSIPPTPETDEDTCFSLRIMRAHGFTGSPIPYVEVSYAERYWAERFLRDTRRLESDKLIAFAPAPGGARADLPDEHICNYRRLPREIIEQSVSEAKLRGVQLVRFGTRQKQAHIYQNYTEIPGVINIPDLSLRQLAACYAVIGRLAGVDTGDHHLMLAVGGECELCVPPSTWFYPHVKHLYGPDAWALSQYEDPRERYHAYDRAMPTILS